jgi:hypothetical protein
MYLSALIRRTLLCAILLLLTAPTASPQESAALRGEPDVSGLYACNGTAPDGQTYRGSVDIFRHDDTYQLLWRFSPDEQYLGLGVVTGDVLAVTYFAGGPGVVAYRIEQDAKTLRLAGEWTVPLADGRVFRETLTRTGDSAGTPHFKVVPHPVTRGARRPA